MLLSRSLPQSSKYFTVFFHRNETGCFHKALPSLRSTYDKVSRKLNNGETNAKKLITRPIMTVTSPNSPHIALTYTKLRFDHFFYHTYPHHGHNCPYILKVGWFSCPVRRVTPKYGSTVKTLTLKICATLFLGASIYVGSMSFHFRNIFQ